MLVSLWLFLVGRGGFEPPKAEPGDLQCASFGCLRRHTPYAHVGHGIVADSLLLGTSGAIFDQRLVLTCRRKLVDSSHCEQR